MFLFFFHAMDFLDYQISSNIVFIKAILTNTCEIY